jgi:single-stranded DNA-binding protein
VRSSLNVRNETNKQLMTSQLYLSGRLVNDPEIGRTKKDKLLVKIILETQQSRETRPGETQTESVNLPITLFAQSAEQVKDLHKGDALTVGCRLYGTEFQPAEGAIKRGVQIIADCVFIAKERPV